jgi:hypothetical protein
MGGKLATASSTAKCPHRGAGGVGPAITPLSYLTPGVHFTGASGALVTSGQNAAKTRSPIGIPEQRPFYTKTSFAEIELDVTTEVPLHNTFLNL